MVPSSTPVEARIIWQGLGNRVEKDFALLALASATLFRCEYATAQSLLEEALAVSRAVEHGVLESNCLGS